MATAIKAENISKEYLISHQTKARYGSLSESLMGVGSRLLNKIKHPLAFDANNDVERFMALDNINFEIRQGDRVGIIGRNGAGKSTLLKILSRITEPTAGTIGINGRIASLLEVGTGFHPELTGRENIFLNGAILGMSKRDIQLRFDEIVDFSEVEKFLDTPVKRYSSGMYVRLAFAIAAHLEPDILILDEVLAVGDEIFQKKCLGKMEEVSDVGKTIVFVSHNMTMVQQLCNRGLYIKSGRLFDNGCIDGVVERYLNLSNSNQIKHGNFSKFESKYLSILDVSIEQKGAPCFVLNRSHEASFSVTVNVFDNRSDLILGYALYDGGGSLLYWSTDKDVVKKVKMKQGVNKVTSLLPVDTLNNGSYNLVFFVNIYRVEWVLSPELSEDSLVYGFSVDGQLSQSSYWQVKRPGVLAPKIEWEHTEC